MFYTNQKEAYRVVSFPSLGRSDHNMVYIQPTYRPCVQRFPVITMSFRKWSPEAKDVLTDCFDDTEWGVLLEEQEIDMDRRVNTIRDYINFCRDTITLLILYIATLTIGPPVISRAS